MSSVIVIVAIIAAVLVVGTVTIGTVALRRRRELQRRFGTEYDRVVSESDSKFKAEAELKGRERRIRDLNIRPLADSAREGYADQWARIQEQFVDTPANAVAESQLLVIAVMNERGYRTAHPDQVLADLSVEHARTLDRYRSADRIRASAASGSVSTEDLRLAMIGYRAVFRDLLGEPDGLPQAAPEWAAPTAEPDAMRSGTQEAQVGAGESRTDDPSYAPQRIG